jgi:ribosomal protein S12 methylthiotransferase
MDIAGVIENLIKSAPAQSRYCLPGTAAPGTDVHGVPRVSVQGASAYIKIADGCSRACAYCAIPLIKGPAISRPVNSIVSEAVYLQSQGIHEIILIAQNTTDYGTDLGLKNGLPRLLREMTAAAPGIDWIRIMYAFPGYVSDELIEVMATHSQIVPYLDIPLQHAHKATLKRMQRPANIDAVRDTFNKIRKAVPGIALRSTFIVGYPGETEAEFRTLLDFVGDIRFDRMGAFKFSFEKGTAGEALGDTVPDSVKEERLQWLMEKQQRISLELNRSFTGRNLDVLIEGCGDGISIGRSYRDAPQVDGLVIVETEIPPGSMVNVQIETAMEYDLRGRVNASDD